MTTGVDRREFLASLLGALVVLPVGQSPQDSLPGRGPAGTVWDPTRAGRPADPVTAADNAVAIQQIEKQLKCTCGCGLDVYTCRTTDFSCTFSPAMHKRVLALAAAGLSEPQIIADFVKQDGPSVLMMLPKHGFNLAGYFVPGAAVLTAGVVLWFALRRWTRAAPAPASAPSAPDASAGELERLQRALDTFDT